MHYKLMIFEIIGPWKIHVTKNAHIFIITKYKLHTYIYNLNGHITIYLLILYFVLNINHLYFSQIIFLEF